MKNYIRLVLFTLCIFSTFSANAQTDVRTMINNNDLSGIEDYCREKLFFTYGGYVVGDCYVVPIDNEIAEKVIEALRYGVARESPECQFMLACVLSENKTIRDVDCDEGTIKPFLPSKDYKYLNNAEAKKLFISYWINPKMDKNHGAFGFSIESIKKMIDNAYPNLIEKYITRKAATSKGVKDMTPPKFGLG